MRGGRIAVKGESLSTTRQNVSRKRDGVERGVKGRRLKRPKKRKGKRLLSRDASATTFLSFARLSES
jgi:hypothetical protein